jgi:phage tail-like protein
MARNQMVMTSNFFVMFGSVKLGFARVSRIDVAYESETVAEGGVNNKVTSLRAPQREERMISMERGSITSKESNEFNLFEVFKTDTRFPVVFVGVNGIDGKMQKMYALHNCVLKRWSLGDLDAGSSNVLIESLDFAYETIEETAVQQEPAK